MLGRKQETAAVAAAAAPAAGNGQTLADMPPHLRRAAAVVDAPGAGAHIPIKPRPATYDEERYYGDGKFDGEVLTASGYRGFVNFSDESRSVVALTDSYYMLINVDQQVHPSVQLVRRVAAQRRYRIDHVVLVAPSVLVGLYETDERRRTEVRVIEDEERRLHSAARRAFDEVIANGARLKASDALVTVRNRATTIEYKIDGGTERVFTVPERLGRKMLQVAWNGANEQSSGGALNETSYESARISGDRAAAPAAGQPGGGKVREDPIILPREMIALRMEFLPVMNGGQYLAARLLYRESGGGQDDVDGLGYGAAQVRQIRSLRMLPHGMNLVVGVTGSGKSTTLQISLKSLMRERNFGVNVLTIEDPVEYPIPGAKQIPVAWKGGSSGRDEAMVNVIRSAMRAAPDVLMVGEIRDAPSADLGVKATLTGHQVWSTIHAISAVRALERMIDEGIAEWRVLDPDMMTGLIGQRLVPKVCPDCALSWREGVEAGRFQEVPTFVPWVEKLLAGSGWVDRLRVRNHAGCRSPACRMATSAAP